jgi:hypothetical protein
MGMEIHSNILEIQCETLHIHSNMFKYFKYIQIH